MRPGSWLAVLVLVACGGGQAASTSPTPTANTPAETETLVVWLVSDSGTLTPNLDDVNCHLPDLQVTVADEDGTVVHTTDRNGLRGKVSQDPYQCRVRTTLSGVPAAGFYQLTVSGGADGTVTVEAGEEATVPLD